jgi:hypothetical protein
MTRPRDDFNDVPILAELGALLERRAASLAPAGSMASGRRDRRHGRFPAVGRIASTLPIVLSVAVAVAVVAVAVVVAGHQHRLTHSAAHPSTSVPAGLGFPRYDPTVQPYITKAQTYVMTHDAGCSRLVTSRMRRISEGTPSQALLSAYGIFRRPVAPTDRPPRGYGTGVNSFVRGVFVRYVRRAQYRYGGGYYLTPAADVIGGREPSRCFTDEIAELHRELPRIPTRLRARALRVQAQQIAFQRYLQLHPEGICVAHLNNKGFGGGGCGAPLADQEHDPGLGESDGDIHYGLVPDGVASITYRYPTTRSARAFTITVPVINNLAVYKAPNKLAGNPTLILNAPNGHVIRTVHTS